MTSHLLIMAVTGAAAASAAPTFSDHLLLNDVLLRIVEAVMVYYPTLVLIMSGLLASSLETAELTPQGFRDVGKGPGSREGEHIAWLTFKDQNQSVLDDVARIQSHPLIPKSIPVHGFLYDVKSGKLIAVEGAQKAAAGV